MNAVVSDASTSAVEPSRSVKRIVRNGLVSSESSTASFTLPRKRKTSSSDTPMISFGNEPVRLLVHRLQVLARGCSGDAEGTAVLGVEPEGKELDAMLVRQLEIARVKLGDVRC